ncbi:MAG TPA: IPT/TIG domain-containing protein [Polyangia bacterium]|nr:IPT/TIG domain-containing protein [Polyangia bacterium]
MRIPERSRLGVAVLVAAGCAGNAEPKVAITAVTPAAAYSNFAISLLIEGGPFRPSYDIDTRGGTEAIEVGAFTAFLSESGGQNAQPVDALQWLSPSQLLGTLASGIPAGTYDVEVRDPRGALAGKPMGFRSLGPDTAKPVLKIDEPAEGTIIIGGAEVPVAFEADDGYGTLDLLVWKVSTAETMIPGSCTHLPGVSRATCRFVFLAPEPRTLPEPLIVLVTATDTASLTGVKQTSLSIGLPPVVSSFEPFAGPSTGGTLVSVHGKNFIAGAVVLVGGAPLLPPRPDVGVVVSDTLIQGLTPAHDPGPATLSVQIGSASVDTPGSFEFVAEPQVLEVSPSSGPSAGCAPVTIIGKGFDESRMTRIWFGEDVATASALQCIDYQGPNRIEGLTPPGSGAVSVIAQDPVGGSGKLSLAYTYLDVDDPDGGDQPAPSQGCPCSGISP